MKIRLTITAFALLLAAGCSGGEGDTPQNTTTTAGGEAMSGEIVALTYNVSGLPEGISSSNPSVNSPLMSPLLNNYELVLLQESWADPDPADYEDPSVLEPYQSIDVFHDDVVAQAAHPYRSEPASQPLGQDPSRDTAFLSDGLNRLSNWPFDEVTRVAWDGCNGIDNRGSDCLAFKGFSVATHTVDDGVEIDVYNLHVETGGSDEDRAQKVSDLEQLAAFIGDHSEGKPIIVGGDTNLGGGTDGANGEIWRTFLDATGSADVCDALECGEDARSKDKFAFRSGNTVTIEPLSQHFEVERFIGEDGEPLSGHDALKVTFAWTLVG